MQIDSVLLYNIDVGGDGAPKEKDMEDFAIMIERPNLKRDGWRFLNADIECGCCGRPIKNRITTNVVVHRGKNEKGEDVFAPIPAHELPNDPVEWGTFVGPVCAKMLPKTHRVTFRKLLKNHAHTWA